MVRAPQPDCFDAVQSFDLMSSARIKLLFRLRGIKPVPVKIGSLPKTTDFILLQEDAGHGFVFGIGYPYKFTKGAGAHSFSEDTVTKPLKALWYWGFEAVSETETIITTVTTVKAANWQTKMLFAAYWFFIKPFSGYIRMIILKKVKKRLEKGG